MEPSERIRRHLLLSMMYERITHMGKESTQYLRRSRLKLLHIEQGELNIVVKYCINGEESEVVFLRNSLNAEVEAMFRALNAISEHN